MVSYKIGVLIIVRLFLCQKKGYHQVIQAGTKVEARHLLLRDGGRRAAANSTFDALGIE